MTQRCATLAEFLVQAPEFLTFGEQSDGTLTVATQPSPGDFITLATRYGVPIVQEMYVADTDFDIGVDEATTATNISTALNGGVLAAAEVSGSVVSVLTTSGPVGALALTSSTVDLVWDETPMTPGEAQVMFALQCACSMINLGCWGIKADCAHIYLTAHMLATQSGQAGGAVSSKSLDKLSISYATATPVDAELSSTKWGRMYLQLQKTILVLPVIGSFGRVC
jgi:hypothetical protein